MPSWKKMAPCLVRTPARRLLWQYRRATSRSRSLPDFIIIGTQKSGTSSLHAYLAQHPQLLPSYAKEVHFFDGGLNPCVDNFEKGEAWYRSHFPLRSSMAADSRTFEASPLYIFNPLTPARISGLVPEVKLVALLRNPTERAISHYFHETRIGHEPLPIKEALLEEEKRLTSVIDKGDWKNNAFIHHSYKSRGLYAQQITRFLDHFPMRQILALSSEEFFREPGKILRLVFEFVGVETGFKVRDLKPRNVASNKGVVDADVYRYLDRYFAPHNQTLYKLIRKSFGWENSD